MTGRLQACKKEDIPSDAYQCGLIFLGTSNGPQSGGASTTRAPTLYWLNHTQAHWLPWLVQDPASFPFSHWIFLYNHRGEICTPRKSDNLKNNEEDSKITHNPQSYNQHQQVLCFFLDSHALSSKSILVITIMWWMLSYLFFTSCISPILWSHKFKSIHSKVYTKHLLFCRLPGLGGHVSHHHKGAGPRELMLLLGSQKDK